MWVVFAFGSAVFAGLVSILAKLGIRHTDSTVATAIRTGVVLVMSVVVCLVTGTLGGLTAIPVQSWIFLVLSGLATGASWLCYFKALQIGDVSKVVPIDKSSTILTVLFAAVLLHEDFGWAKAGCLLALGIGTYLMIGKTEHHAAKSKSWLIFALLSALFAAATGILAKIGVKDVDSNLATAVRTAVVLLMSWVMVFATGKKDKLKSVPRNELGWIAVSGLSTGASWLCYYKALKDGLATVVVPIDKLSVLLTVGFSVIFLKEKLPWKAWLGLGLITAGTLAMLFV